MQKIMSILHFLGSFLKKLFTDKKFLICLAILCVPVVIGFAVVVVVYNHYLPELPSLAQLEQINPKLVTNIYDMNGKIAHEYFVERREWTPFDSIPENAIHAVMATEDRAFYNHWGMNVWAIPPAVIQSKLSGKQLRGASTLTQQLTKLLFLTPERSISRKIKEAMTAIRIEQTYTKQEILEFYMNEVYLAVATTVSRPQASTTSAARSTASPSRNTPSSPACSRRPNPTARTDTRRPRLNVATRCSSPCMTPATSARKTTAST